MYRRLDREGKAVRVPAMRRTVFLVPRANVQRVFTAARASSAYTLRPLKRYGLSVDYDRMAERVLAAASEPVRTRELERLVGIKAEQLAAVLRALRYEGRVLTLAGDSLLTSPHRYVATTTWLSEGLEFGDVDDARAWLAGAYLQAYGPARAADFEWWTGLGKRASAKAFEQHITIDISGGLMLLAKDERAFVRTKPLRNCVGVLPKWDAYTMGYAPDGRARFVHPDVQPRVYTPIGTGLAGDANAVVLVDGEAVATWTYTLKDGAVAQPFDTLGARTHARVVTKLEEVAALLTA